MYYDFFSIIGSEEGGIRYEAEFQKNNYYGLSDFEQIWNETKAGGISNPESE